MTDSNETYGWDNLTTVVGNYGIKRNLWVPIMEDCEIATMLDGVSPSLAAAKRYVETMFASEPGKKRWRRNSHGDWAYEVKSQ